MITAAYYAGLLVWCVPIFVGQYLSEKWSTRLGRVIVIGVLGYFYLGYRLLGWKMGIANVAILFVAANVLNLPFERLVVRRFFPQAKFRSSLSPKAQIKLAKFGRRHGLNKWGR